MKRLLIVFTLALATLLPAAASGQLLTFQLSQELLDFIAAAPPADDLVAGEGKFAPTEKGESAQLTVSAHGPGGPGSQPAKGNVRIKIGGVEERGRVECMRVTGNTAVIVGSFDEPIELHGLPFPDFFISILDNGEPNGQNPPDEAHIFFDLDPNPCGLPHAPFTGGELVQGNIVVMDRP
jgi:hypothetical protein